MDASNTTSPDPEEGSEFNPISHDQEDRSKSSAVSQDQEDRSESSAVSQDQEDRSESNTVSQDQEDKFEFNPVSVDQEDASESDPVTHEQEFDQHAEAPHNEAKSEDTFISKLYWFFEPIFPVYKMVKSSNEYTKKVFGILEHIVFTLLSLLENSGLLSKEGKQKDSDSHDPLLSSLFKRWFQAHKNLRQSIYYIEAFYEEIVPLIPGQHPLLNNMDAESMSIRSMCCYATLHMLCRLPYHAAIYIRKIFKQIKSFILKPTERIALDLI